MINMNGSAVLGASLGWIYVVEFILKFLPQGEMDGICLRLTDK